MYKYLVKYDVDADKHYFFFFFVIVFAVSFHLRKNMGYPYVNIWLSSFYIIIFLYMKIKFLVALINATLVTLVWHVSILYFLIVTNETGVKMCIYWQLLLKK